MLIESLVSIRLLSVEHRYCERVIHIIFVCCSYQHIVCVLIGGLNVFVFSLKFNFIFGIFCGRFRIFCVKKEENGSLCDKCFLYSKNLKKTDL